MVLIILALLGIGTLMVFSSSSATAYVGKESSYYFLTRHILYVIISLVVMIGVSRINYHFFTNWAVIIFAGAMILLILVLIPGVGLKINNARRWLGYGSFTIQPSEIIKIAAVLLFANFFSTDAKTAKNTKLSGFIKCLVIIVAIFGLLYFEPHISCAIIVCGTCVILMFLGGTKKRYMGVTFGTLAAGGVVAFSTLNHVRERFLTFLDPFKYANDEGYQVVQSLLAIGSGGLAGKGLGQSVQKYLYLPEPYNDFIFSILAEELGFIGCVGVILLFGLFIFRGYTIAYNAPDKEGKLVAAGITTIIAIQAIMNIAVVTSSMPVTGVALPFFSYGGTSLIVMMANMGILLNISAKSDYKKF